MPDPHTHSGEAALNGALLYYEVAGSGSPLILVHSGIADSRMWDDQWVAFSQRFQVVRYDMRGFGRSASVAGNFSHTSDLLAMLDFLAVRKATLLGCSKGGSIVLDYTLEHPERVAGLVLVTSSPAGFPFDGELPPQWDEMVAAFKQGDFDRAAELEVQIWVDCPHRSPEQVDPAVRARVQAMDRIALANEAQGLGTEVPLEANAADRLSEVKVPTLIVYGDLDDPNIIRAADFMAKHIPGAQKSLIPETAHFPNMEQPERFNRLVMDFLLEHPALSNRWW